MAEEKIDGLEGLDDFGDDFSEQLDAFMESEGEDESDSELDSFFEDLSTIDDLEDDEKVIVEDDKKAVETEAVLADSSEKARLKHENVIIYSHSFCNTDTIHEVLNLHDKLR